MQVIDTLTSSVIDLYTNNKLSYHKIAKQCHIDLKRIHDILYSNHIHVRHICHHIEIEPSELERLYNVERLSSVDIGSRYGVTFPTVIRKLREYGIPVRENHTYTKNIITPNTVHPSINMDIVETINGKRYGLSTCPNCGAERRTQLRSVRNKAYTGLCYKCAMSSRAKKIDISLVIKLYNEQRLTVPKIAQLFSISTRRMRQIMVDNGIPTRRKGELKIKVINNTGTLGNPVVGDLCRGYDIGLNDKSYYVRVSCPKCHEERWQVKSHVVRSPICKPCAMKQMGLNSSGDKSVAWLGGISFEPYDCNFNEHLKEQIRQRDNYICRLCGKPQGLKKLPVHHIDYNKKHSINGNLISLCGNCHSLTNHNRSYWTEYFSNLLLADKNLTTTLC